MAVYTYQNVTITDSSCSSTAEFSVIQLPRTVSNEVYFKNNHITYCPPAVYIAMLGDDGPGANDNNLDGAIASGNKIIHTGFDINPSGVMHGLMAGYQINQVFKWNYFDDVCYPVVYKSGGGTDHDGMTNTSGGFFYNVVINGKRLGIKGTSGVRVYNNTFYCDRDSSLQDYPFIKILSNNDEPLNTPLPPSSGTQIKNNIFYSTFRKKFFEIEFSETSLDASFGCDYNIYFCEDGSDNIMFQIDGATWITFAEWQALGYDQNSIILDPSFVDRVNLVPLERLDYGIYVGDDYLEGLATNAEWILADTSIVGYVDPSTSGDPSTNSQDPSTWQVGAYVFDPDSSIYYVAPDGNDSNPGTFSQPWQHWSKAFASAMAGTTVYFRDGTYPMDVMSGLGLSVTNNGTSGNTINFFNYPGEIPVLDCSGVPHSGFNAGFRLINSKYLHFKGLHIININELTVPAGGGLCYGINADGNDHVTYENMVIHDMGGKAFMQIESKYTEIINCDAYNCADQYSVLPGSWATGFGNANTVSTDGYTYMYGCRAWNCSDQGYSSGGDRGTVIYDTCWTWDNGKWNLGNEEGFGFKLGYMFPNDSSTDPGVVMVNCIVTNNLFGGITTNDQGYWGQYMYLYNNFVYKNGPNYGFFILNPSDNKLRRSIRNNISYDNSLGNDVYGPGDYNHSNNTWDTAITVTDADFVSLDYTQLAAPRNSDGSLPTITFGHLNPDSSLINAGIKITADLDGSVGYALLIDADGNAYLDPPSLGAYQYIVDSSSSGVSISFLPISFSGRVVSYNSRIVR